MHDSADLSAQILDVSSLPSLPQTLVDLIDECNKKDIDINILGEIVARDVFVSTRVLQLVNSAFIGARATFSDIVQAVIYLGVDTTRNLAVSVAVHETFKTIRTGSVVNLLDFWRHSFLTAVIAKSLALAVGEVHPSEAYLTGLLHDIGKLLLLRAFPEQYREIVAATGTIGLEAREREMLNITHSEAAALLIRHWHLQWEIAEAILCHHHGYSKIAKDSIRAKILFGANQLSNCPLPDSSPVAEIVCETLNISHKTLFACIEDSLATVGEITEHMGIGTRKEPGTGRKKSPSRLNQQKEGLSRRVSTFSRLSGFLDNLVKARDMNEVFRVIERSLHILFSVDGCLFLLPERNGGFDIRGSSDNPILVRARELQLDLDDLSGMLSSCLKDRAVHDSFSFAKANELSSLDLLLLKLFQSDGLMTVPIIIAGKEPGVFLIGTGLSGIDRLYDNKETLLLLTGYSGMRFRLEDTYQKYASDLAASGVKAVTEVARSLAHEISNPIATLQNYLAVLGLKLEDRPDLAVDLEIIDREIGRIGEISEQLQDLSAQDPQLRPEPVDLKSLLSDIVMFFRQSMTKKQDIGLQLSLPKGLPILSSSGAKIRQIIGNIVKNSIEAIEMGGTISITVELEEPAADQSRAVRISVSDDGPGVGLPNIEDVFQAGVTTKKGRHAGLGLAIAMRLATQLGGRLQCAKRQQGGVVFSLTLPV